MFVQKRVNEWGVLGLPEFYNEAVATNAAYKEFALQKMLRPDGTHFFGDLQVKQSQVGAGFHTEKTYGHAGPAASGSSDFELKFVVYTFSLPPGNLFAKTFVRCRDFQSMLALNRADKTDT